MHIKLVLVVISFYALLVNRMENKEVTRSWHSNVDLIDTS